MVVTVLLILAYSYYFYWRFEEESRFGIRVQYIYTYVLFSVVTALANLIIYCNRKMGYFQHLKQKESRLEDLLEELNMTQFSKGDLEFNVGDFGVWFAVHIRSQKCRLLIHLSRLYGWG